MLVKAPRSCPNRYGMFFFFFFFFPFPFQIPCLYSSNYPLIDTEKGKLCFKGQSSPVQSTPFLGLASWLAGWSSTYLPTYLPTL